MSIVEKLRKLIRSKGGSPIGVMTIADGVHKLQKMEDLANPLSALTVDVEIGASEDLLGKVIADLQKDVVVGVDKITGTLKYITGYTEFSSVVAEQSGNYLVLHASVPDVTGETIKFKHSAKAGDVTLDADGIIIFRVDPKYMNEDLKITFVASKEGYAPYSKTFDLSKLILTKPST